MNWGITAVLFSNCLGGKNRCLAKLPDIFSKRFQVDFMFDVPSICLFWLLLLHPHPPQELESRKEEIFHLENQIKEFHRRSAGKNAS